MARPSKKQRRQNTKDNDDSSDDNEATPSKPRTPEWFAKKAAAHPKGNMPMKTLRQGFGSDDVVSSMTSSLTDDAQKEPTLLDRATYNTNSGEFKAAKKRVLDKLANDQTFKPCFDATPDDWRDAALNGLWTFANKGLKLRTGF
ncbi:hypothetical protein K504DRAFT_509132, partial [Pleomassaria siparia CBS 279.74]